MKPTTGQSIAGLVAVISIRFLYLCLSVLSADGKTRVYL